MTVAIVDCGSGNLRSAAKAFERAAAENGMRAKIRVTSVPEVVGAADHIVLPGVGAFADCRHGLSAVTGLEAALHEAVILRGRPFLGICVGMQLMAEWGREFKTTRGLGWIGGEVARLDPADTAVKVPHVGWNDVAPMRPHCLFTGLGSGPQMYFTHSYTFRPNDVDAGLALTDHGGPFVSAVAKGVVAGVQFHPEKSQGAGLRLIANFLEWRP